MNNDEKDWAHSPRCAAGEPEFMSDHAERVSRLAEKFAGRFGAGNWGRIEGLLHDLGKHDPAFQKYIRGLTQKSTHHAAAGAQYAYGQLGIVGRLLAYCLAGHHAGLPDFCKKETSGLSLQQWLEEFTPNLEEHVPPALMDIPLPYNFPIPLDGDDDRFQISFFVRMLFSALVDADYLATEGFMNPQKNARRDRAPRLSELLPILETHLHSISNGATKINLQRKEILRHCMEAAKWSSGLFSLTVPTGGGKTLASLMFALKHAVEQGMDRVIFVVPFCAVIEQTAQVYRSVFKGLTNATIIEHHSAFDFPKKGSASLKLSTENWDGSIIVTTAVQFFDSLFACRPSTCRKLHRIAKSVIVLDEAQTLPVGLLSPCLSALRAITHYGSSVVLCTATQPALGHRPDFRQGLKSVREIIPDPESLYKAMRRVRIVMAGHLSNNELIDRLKSHANVLCIVNTTKHAALIASSISGAFHLSARMCPAHREFILSEIKENLLEGIPTRLVGTPVIEAGVDIDFVPIGYRAMAGVDQIAQAAGRVNREAKISCGELVVFDPEEIFPPGHIRQRADAGRQVLPDHIEDPLSLGAIYQFFKLYYWKTGKHDIYAVLPRLRGGDKIQFREAADRFSMINTPTVPLIIPWGKEGECLCADLKECDPELDPRKLRYLSRSLQRYSVNVWPADMEKLDSATKIEWIHGSFAILSDMTYYSTLLGLVGTNVD